FQITYNNKWNKYLPSIIRPRIGMNNTDWILRISAQLEGDTETRIMLKEFYFNPAKIQFLDKDEYIKHFVLSEEDLSLKVYFYYIKI
ncbi:MAG: hypothetical protein ACOCXH_11855, partial [Cyclobacteriaceae bacterium]